MNQVPQVRVSQPGDFIIYVDEREKKPRSKLQRIYGKFIEFKTLPHGDYACSLGCCGFERKEGDFTLSNIHQIKTQLFELKKAFQSSYLVVCLEEKKWLNDERYAEKLGFLSRLAQIGFVPKWEPDHIRMFDWIYGVIKKNHDGKYVGDYEFSSVRRIKNKDRSKHILLSLPNVGPKMAERILDLFGSVGEFVRAEPEKWMEIEGMGPKTRDQILDALWKGGDHDD